MGGGATSAIPVTHQRGRETCLFTSAVQIGAELPDHDVIELRDHRAS
jgi:hypothetical protein